MALSTPERLPETAKFAMTNEGKVIRTYSSPARVKSTDDLDLFQLGIALGYLPGQPHPTDPEATLRDMSLERTETIAPCVWYTYTLNYSTEAPAPAATGETPTADPTKQRVKRRWTTSEQTLYEIRDINGDLILNAAQQPFDGGVPISIALPTLTYVRNESTFDGSVMVQYANALNKYAFSGAEPETLRLKISADEMFEGNYQYWAVHYEMAYNPKGWQPQPCNAGLYQRVDGELVKCMDRDLQPVSSPVPLDEDGVQIPLSGLPDDVNYVKVDLYPLIDFSDLGLEEA